MVKREAEKSQHERALDVIQSVYEGFKEDPKLWTDRMYFRGGQSIFQNFTSCCTMGGLMYVSGSCGHPLVQNSIDIIVKNTDSSVAKANDRGYDSTMNMLETTLKKEGRL